MKTNKPNVRRFYDMGCPEQICCVDIVRESDDGDYVLYEDYEALKAEFEELRKDAERYRWLREKCGSSGLLTIAKVGAFELNAWSGDDPDAAIDAAMAEQEADHG